MISLHILIPKFYKYHSSELVCTNIPEVPHGKIITRTVGILEFDDEAKVQCDFGFRNNGVETVKCLANQTLSTIPVCADINECAEQASSCSTKSTVCKNLAGGYFCECRQGFQPQKGKLSVTEIVFIMIPLSVEHLSECISRQKHLREKVERNVLGLAMVHLSWSDTIPTSLIIIMLFYFLS